MVTWRHNSKGGRPTAAHTPALTALPRRILCVSDRPAPTEHIAALQDTAACHSHPAAMHPHFSHQIHWTDLAWALSRPSETGVAIPVRACGRIHPDTSHTRQLLANRAYLVKYVCPDADCAPSPSDEQGTFYKDAARDGARDDTLVLFEFKRDVKNGLHRGGLQSWQDWTPTTAAHKRLHHFLDSFLSTLQTLGDTEAAKILSTTTNLTRTACEQRCAQIRALPTYSDFWHDCDLVLNMLIRGEVLLAIRCHDVGILDLPVVRAQTFGGQAVGNYWNFLLYHLLRVYLGTNAILAAGTAGLKVDDKSQGEFMRGITSMLSDCDGRTFLPSLRPALDPGVFLKDGDATRDMLKALFRFFALFGVLERRGLAMTEDEWRTRWAELVLDFYL
ncbi:hypothetical protein M427DRAFT_38759 [Gonapodya prolifera JEL478]|uniref:Uncharacterized protein n=1 Tax=Gonapodya prolifera (strain JEL478) TaxID=1344416 RepID=A0A138ZYH9_GONPJ|nr:hypothetical protein M427DRAFT_38759 [Gonapodya prolifera JEL478]|eukprot:KXS09540.1 hypothetical protein M427DRAFT_38759 [Gonapodya prolifera JEL478]